jgi:hypothetical protein
VEGNVSLINVTKRKKDFTACLVLRKHKVHCKTAKNAGIEGLSACDMMLQLVYSC